MNPRAKSPRRAGWALPLVALVALTGCGELVGKVKGLLGEDPAAVKAAADAALVAGDLPTAIAAYEAAVQTNPTDVDLATGAAYGALLAGDAAKADAYLAAAEAGAGDRLGEVKLRRALVALQQHNVDGVKEHAVGSTHPAARLLLAETLLADGEPEAATEHLKAVAAEAGPLGAAAKGYLNLLEDEDTSVSGLAEAQALWALGVRDVAVKSAFELVRLLPEEREDRGELLLVWASRAATVKGQTESARAMLELSFFPPDGQAWRKPATLAIIACAEGNGADCEARFAQLEGAGDPAGLADARATAAYLIAETDADVASRLVGSIQSDAAARALLEAGDRGKAKSAASSAAFKSYLEAGG